MGMDPFLNDLKHFVFVVSPFGWFFSQSGHCVPDVEVCNVVHILGHLSGCFAEFKQRMLRFDIDFFNMIHIRNTSFPRELF